MWRRHPWTMARQAFLTLAGTLIPVVAFAVFGASLVTSILIAIWLIFIPALVWLTWYEWWNDIYILTNQRLIDIDQKQLFHRTVAEVPLENLQDVTFEVRGIFPTLLNYGNVEIQTASFTEIDMVGVTDPQAVHQAVLRTAAKLRKDNPLITSTQIKKKPPKRQLG